MKALSIRQPWASMILHYGKDIENRTWPTNVRGRVLIHASKGMTFDEWSDAWDFAVFRGVAREPMNDPEVFLRGGIVGSVEIVDCVTRSESAWFEGPFGFVLRNPVTLPFYPFRGALGFFDVSLPLRVCRVCGCWEGDCRQCIERTGEPCHWVAPDLCSACEASNATR
jgi:hypothetical protein